MKWTILLTHRPTVCNLSRKAFTVLLSRLVRGFLRIRWRFAGAAIGAASMQVEVGAQKREAVRHGRRSRWGLVEAEYLPTTVAAKMDVLIVLTVGRDRKTEHAVSVGILVRQATFNQPVEYAIQRYTIECRFSKRLFDLVVAQRSRRRAQQMQDADSRRGRACAAAPYLRGNGIGIQG